VHIAIWQGESRTSSNLSTSKVRLKFCLQLNQNGNQGHFIKADGVPDAENILDGSSKQDKKEFKT